MKIVFILAVLPFLSALIFVLNIRLIGYITIVSLFFPIHILFMGRDAITTGTICIFVLYFKYLIEYFNARKEKFNLWIYSLILLVGTSTIFVIWTGQKEQIGPAVRQYVEFCGALLFFIVIINYRSDNVESNPHYYNDYIEKLLSLFLLLVSLHILISISIKIFPSLGSAFSIFYSRDVDVIEFTRGGRDEIERISSFVFNYEYYGEILAALCPLVLYKIYRFRNPIWLLCLLLFSIGEILAVTRSGIILFMIGVVISLLYHFKEKLGKTLVLSCSFLTVLATIISLFPSILADVFLRFKDATEVYRSTGNVFDTINRGGFPDIWDYVSSNLTLFGHDMVRVDFHNLFLTSLHQMGILGMSLFFVVLLYPAARLIKAIHNEASANKTLIFSCILSTALFLLNETKVEFTRGASYQQIWWGLFATYYLVSKSPLQSKE